MKRVITDPSHTGSLTFGEAKEPLPLPHQSLIKVTHYSLNRGEINIAQGAEKGSTIGWDYVGTISQTAVNDRGLPKGTRVVGWRPEMDAFAEYVIGEPLYFAPIPEGVSDAQAATLPVAGLTALAAIDKGTRLVGNSVLVNGITGGVGFFALQLAKLSGARVVAQVRKPEQADFAQRIGADAVVVTTDGTGLEAEGPYRLVVDGVSGSQIVKNEAKHLPRCLDSVQDYVDEIIVLDTGSQDETIEIAQARGAIVEAIEWTQDFAAARNQSLAKATGDWILVLDADETLTAGGRAVLKQMQDAEKLGEHRIDSLLAVNVLRYELDAE
ncbi:MAG: glycosyltransferase, partial [Leptolyngbya sp. SIO1D8]|nr:glycosyltransferase [Leptolyngbya sp. SIO1D8]